MNEVERYAQDVADAWNALPNSAKPDLMLTYPELYWACAWLSAHMTVRKEGR